MSLMPQPATLTTAFVPETAALRIDVAQDVAAVAKAWAELERAAPASVYQTRAWVHAWLRTFGAAEGVTPMFVQAHDRAGAAIALLCLGVTRNGPLRIAGFLGGKESNFNLGLFRPQAEWSRASLRALLGAATRGMGAMRPDLFLLQNQPVAWESKDNPLALLAHQIAPSFAYESTLGGDAEGFLAAHLSKDSRKKLRKKEARLAGMGTLRHVVARDTPTAMRILDALLRQKRERFESAAAKAHFENPALRDFLGTLAGNGAGALELHALLLDERIIATYAGALHQGRFSCMYNSFDADTEIGKSSPGDILLTKLIAAKCIEGVTRFDLGIGEARYKNSFCDAAVPLFDAVVPVTAVGHLAAPVVAAKLRAKRLVKQNPKLMSLTQRLRG